MLLSLIHFRRSVYNLLIASSLSLSICCATLSSQDDDNEALPTPKTQIHLSEDSKASCLLFEAEILHPFWNSLFEVLAPLDRDSLTQASKQTYSARRLFDRTQILRVKLSALSTRSYELSCKSYGLLSRYKGLVPIYSNYFFEPHGYSTQYIFERNIYSDREEINMFFSYISKMSYVDLNVENMPAAVYTLMGLDERATAHLSVERIITSSDLKALEEFLSRNNKLKFLFMKLNSFRVIRVIVDNSDTAINFLTLWSHLIQIKDRTNINLRPHLQIFVREFTNKYQLTGIVPSDVEIGHKTDPRKGFAKTSQKNQETLSSFEKEYDEFSKFLAPYHEGRNENDLLAGAFQGSLLKLLSYSEILDGASFLTVYAAGPSVSADRLISNAIIFTIPLFPASALNNMGLVENLYRETVDFSVRKEILSLISYVAATTLLEAMTSPIVNAFPSSSDSEISSKVELIKSLTNMPNFFQKSAMEAIMQTEAFRGKKMSTKEVTYLMQFLYFFDSKNYREILERLCPLRPTAPEANSDWEENFYDDLKVFTNMKKQERMDFFRKHLDAMLLISPGLNPELVRANKTRRDDAPIRSVSPCLEFTVGV